MGRDPQTTDQRTSEAVLAVIVTIMLLIVLLFSVLVARLHLDTGPAHGATGSVTPTMASIATTTSAATPMAQDLPAGMSVANIAMVSASDGWAIAAPTATSSVLVHYSGGRWMLSGDTYEGVELTDISMDAHDDGWAVGLYADQSGGVVLHYSGGRWHPVPTPQISFAGSGVWAFSPSQALVLATLPSQQSALLHYNNGVWTETASPRGITAMSVLSADDVWATCFDSHILHEQGGRWTTYTIGGRGRGQGHSHCRSPCCQIATAGWLVSPMSRHRACSWCASTVIRGHGSRDQPPQVRQKSTPSRWSRPPKAGRVATSGTPRAPRRCCSTMSMASGRRPQRPPTEASGRSSWSQRRRGGRPSRVAPLPGCCTTRTGAGRRSNLPNVKSNDKVVSRQCSHACAEKLSRQGPPGGHPAQHTRRRSRCGRAASEHLQPQRHDELRLPYLCRSCCSW